MSPPFTPHFASALAKGDLGTLAARCAEQLPQDSLLMFSIRSVTPESFSRTEQIEVGTVDGAFSTRTTMCRTSGIRTRTWRAPSRARRRC